MLIILYTRNMLGIMFNTEKQKNVSRYPTEKNYNIERGHACVICHYKF